MDYKELLMDFYSVLNANREVLGELGVDIDLVIEAQKYCEDEEGYWAYSVPPIRFCLGSDLVSAKTKPSIIKTCDESISIELIINHRLGKERREIQIKKTATEVTDIVDFETLEIQIKAGEYIAAWHLDKHIYNDGDGEGDYMHPLYHFTFGGERMSELDDDYGNIIIIDSPRLMHPPMELIIAFDFILRQFIPKSLVRNILEAKPYNDVVEKAKKHIWKPYALAFAKNYCSTITVGSESLTFDDTFCKQVIGE